MLFFLDILHMSDISIKETTYLLTYLLIIVQHIHQERNQTKKKRTLSKPEYPVLTVPHQQGLRVRNRNMNSTMIQATYKGQLVRDRDNILRSLQTEETLSRSIYGK